MSSEGTSEKHVELDKQEIEQLKQEIENAELEIRELESNLGKLHLTRRQLKRRLCDANPPAIDTSPGKPKGNWEEKTKGGEGEPFFIKDKDDLLLDSMPELARVILDALPVSVFLKLDDGSEENEEGRTYRYINAKARRVKGWHELDVRDMKDNEAFSSGEWGDPFYQIMFKQETETLKVGKARETLLTWKSDLDVWRRAKTYEIPIYLVKDKEKDGKKPVGFCAIAQENTFAIVPRVHGWVWRTFQHEFGNTIGDGIARALRPVERLIKDKVICGEEREIIRTGIDSMGKYIDLHRESLDVLRRALVDNEGDALKPVGHVVDVLNELFSESPYNVRISVADGLDSEPIPKHLAIAGVLTSLLLNAGKHSRPYGEASVDVTACDKYILWRVANPTKEKVDWSLTLSNFDEWDPSDDENTGLSGVIIGEILYRNFESDNWYEMIEGPFFGDSEAAMVLKTDRV